MLYEPPKTKQYIIIGVVAVFLAILIAFGLSLVYKNKKVPTPVDNTANQEKIKQEKIQEELKKLDEVKKSENNAPEPAPAEIQTELKRLDEAKKNSNTSPPTQEDIQKQLDLLNKMKK